ncbi:MAG: Mur ligase domain-containing protein, partial [Oscillospiraceae bacterium]|nr:Mur ligase domain-containing protein [Oscillospiraceae bacterium]
MSFEDYLTSGRSGHLIGIGGVSMSPLGEVLSGMGLNIRGSDTRDSVNVEHLRALGIKIAIGHAAENIAPDTDFVVRTAAVHDDNVEVMEARRRGIPVFERSEAWGAIMKDYKNALCISGTHGKTTTTSMSTHIMIAAQRDPTEMIGGTLPLLHAGHRVGKGDTIILESCEYYNSFLKFSPTVAVILNIDNDHLDFFKDIDDKKKSCRTFAELVPPIGLVVAIMDAANTMA